MKQTSPNNKDRRLVQILNYSFLYLDDAMSLNNSRFCDFLHFINPNDSTDTQIYAVFPPSLFHGFYISQLLRYSRPALHYINLLARANMLM